MSVPVDHGCERVFSSEAVARVRPAGGKFYYFTFISRVERDEDICGYPEEGGEEEGRGLYHSTSQTFTGLLTV